MHAVHACCTCTASVCAVHTILGLLASDSNIGVTNRNPNMYRSIFMKYMIQNSESQLQTKVEVQSLTFVLSDSY